MLSLRHSIPPWATVGPQVISVCASPVLGVTDVGLHTQLSSWRWESELGCLCLHSQNITYWAVSSVISQLFKVKHNLPNFLKLLRRLWSSLFLMGLVIKLFLAHLVGSSCGWQFVKEPLNHEVSSHVRAFPGPGTWVILRWFGKIILK